MISGKTYVKCLNNIGTSLENNLEYEVFEIKYIDKMGDNLFFLLKDGLWYCSSHFTVTYLK